MALCMNEGCLKMIRLQKYRSNVSLEALADELETYQNISLTLSTYHGLLGLEAFDYHGIYEKVKDVVVRSLEALAAFLRGLWSKFIGEANEEEVISDTEVKMAELEPQKTKVSDDVSEAITEMVRENTNPDVEPIVPPALPKQLCTRLINAHNGYFNTGPAAFKLDIIKEVEWLNELPELIMDLLSTHKVALDAVLADKEKSVSDYHERVASSSSYSKLKSEVLKAGVELHEFDYKELFYGLNDTAANYKRSSPIRLDIDSDAVYRAKLGELKAGLKQLRSGAKLVKNTLQRAEQMQTAVTRLGKSLTDQDKIEKIKICTRDLTGLTVGMRLVLKLRKSVFDANIDYIDTVIAVMQHPTFKQK